MSTIALSHKGAKLMKLCDLEGYKRLHDLLRASRPRLYNIAHTSLISAKRRVRVDRPDNTAMQRKPRACRGLPSKQAEEGSRGTGSLAGRIKLSDPVADRTPLEGDYYLKPRLGRGFLMSAIHHFRKHLVRVVLKIQDRHRPDPPVEATLPAGRD
jgi:hypothetical protein